MSDDKKDDEDTIALHRDGVPVGVPVKVEEPFGCLAVTIAKSQRAWQACMQFEEHIASHIPTALKWLFETLPESPLAFAIRKRQIGVEQIGDAMIRMEGMEPVDHLVRASLLASALVEISRDEKRLEAIEKYENEGAVPSAYCH